MKRVDFEIQLNTLLNVELIKDYCPNGLQVEGTNTINKVVTGVTASMALIEQAIAEKADALVVHHGYFWKNETSVIRGIKYQRIKALLENNINLFAYHLPLDVHPQLGNNAQLANLLAIDGVNAVESVSPLGVLMQGKLATAIAASDFSQQISEKLQRQCLHIAPIGDKPIQRVAWCTGGGQDFIEQAAEQGVDAFISGEISEKTTHIAREMNIHYFAAGHHATERYGVKSLAEYINNNLAIDAKFIDVDNPA